MGYYTEFTLSYDKKANPDVEEFFEFRLIKDLPYTKLKTILPNIEEHFEKMEELTKKLDKLLSASEQSASEMIQWMSDLRTTSEGMKWYNHEADMKVFSKLFPKALLTLEGKGEESGDLWIKYFQNGKVQVAKARIAYDDFDPAKLR